MNKFVINDLLSEIVDLASQALVSDDEAVKSIALGDIAQMLDKKVTGLRASLPGCPSSSPAKVIPHDEPAADVPRTEEEKQGACSCFSLGNGAFPIRRANTEAGTMEHVWIDGRRFTMEVVVAETVDGITKECEFTIRNNGQIKLDARYYGGKSNAAKIAHKALKTYVKQLTGASKFHSRGGFLKQALKRYQEAQEKEQA